MRVAFWGTYDLGKPRNRILLRGLRSLHENGVEVLECHRPIWEGVEDKSRLTMGRRLRFVLRWLAAYPALVLAYLRLPRHDVVLIGYLGQLDVLVLWPFARLRRVPVVWDAFLSLHDTVVDDRALVGPRHPLARLLYAWEWLAARAADRVLLDTRAHAEAFARSFGLRAERVGSVLVGAEPEAFPAKTPFSAIEILPTVETPRGASPSEAPAAPQGIQGMKDAAAGDAPRGVSTVGVVSDRSTAVRILFYGQLIPLHGVETIVRAARLARDEAFEWVLIGQGQEEEKVRRMLEEEPLPRLQWVPWVPYEELARWIGAADVCLGIFGASGKAARVIPNKVFQVLSAGKPLVTRDSPAIRELLSEEPGVYLVPPADPQALLAALHRFRADRASLAGRDLHAEIRERITPKAIGRDLLALLAKVADAA